MELSLSEATNLVGGRMMGPDVRFSSVSIDTRNLRAGDLFVAIEGVNYDAHDFLDQAKKQGAAAVLVSRDSSVDLPLIRVDNTRSALGRLARGWRQHCPIPLVGVTGSNGKTSVKEMLASILGVGGDVLYTKANLNNDIGVPLTLLRLNESHRYAVIELGANHFGEIAYTAGLALPDVVIITNAGSAHLEGFGSVDGVARAKGELVEALGESGVAVLNADDPFFEFWKNLAGEREVISFGLSPAAEVRASEIAIKWQEDRFCNRFKLSYRDIQSEVTLQLAGSHNICNALSAAAAALVLGIGIEQIVEGLEQVRPVKGRMEPVSGIQGSLLFDDTYNANPSSFEAAIDLVAQMPGEAWVILGAFAELGESSAELHAEVGFFAKQNGITHLLATGSDAAKAVESFGDGGVYFEKQEDLIQAAKNSLHSQVVVLIKGSRSQKMERVVDELREKGLN